MRIADLPQGSGRKGALFKGRKHILRIVAQFIGHHLAQQGLVHWRGVVLKAFKRLHEFLWCDVGEVTSSSSLTRAGLATPSSPSLAEALQRTGARPITYLIGVPTQPAE